MNDTEPKYIQAITKLIQLTQKRQIKWSKAKSNEMPSTIDSDEIGFVFITNYKGKKIRIYEKKIELPKTLGNMMLSRSHEVNIILEILEDNKSIWKFPDESVISDLFSEIKFQLSGVSEYIDKILED